MEQLLRTARSRVVPGVGYARRGVIHTVPADMVEELLATGEWARVDPAQSAGEPERVVEPAPAQPAAKAASKPRAKPKAKK